MSSSDETLYIKVPVVHSDNEVKDLDDIELNDPEVIDLKDNYAPNSFDLREPLGEGELFRFIEYIGDPVGKELYRRIVKWGSKVCILCGQKEAVHFGQCEWGDISAERWFIAPSEYDDSDYEFELVTDAAAAEVSVNLFVFPPLTL